MGSQRYIENILCHLNGCKVLIVGSHDKQAVKCTRHFKEITPLKELKTGKLSITLCHYAMRAWPKSHYNTWHLYGHSHGNLAPEGKSWDVGVDNNDFIPLSLNEIEKIMAKRPDNFNLVKK